MPLRQQPEERCACDRLTALDMNTKPLAVRQRWGEKIKDLSHWMTSGRDSLNFESAWPVTGAEKPGGAAPRLSTKYQLQAL